MPEGIDFIFLVNRNGAEALSAINIEGTRIEVRTIDNPFTEYQGGRGAVEYVSESDVYKKTSFLGYFNSYATKLFGAAVGRVLGRWGGAWSLSLYTLKLMALTRLYVKGVIFRDADLIWVPAPSVPFVEQFDSRVLYSFWDPFVVEYTEFNDTIRNLYAKKFRNMFAENKKSFHIVTQSKANKDYLTCVMGVSLSRVSVVRLGCPDYSVFVKEKEDQIKDFKKSERNNLLSLWERKTRYPVHREKFNIDAYIDQITKEVKNHSLFFRLAKGVQPRSKIIFISTQDRPYKGLGLVFKVLAAFRKKHPEYKLHILTTAVIPADVKKMYPELYESVVEMRRLPNDQHALCTAVSDIVLHPSFVEGGLGSYSMFEAASVGVPSLTNEGRYTEELQGEVGGGINLAFCDFTDLAVSVDKIHRVLSDRLLAEEVVKEVMGAWYSWNESAERLIEVFEICGAE